MRLTQINHFMAVLAHGGVRAAARILKAAPPVLTRSVRELERELGVQLLERTGHGLVPTAAGKTFAASARIIQNELTRIEQGSLKQATGAGVVTLGLAPSAVSLLPGALARFRKSFPYTDVRIVGGPFGALKAQLRTDKIDFGIGLLPPEHRETYLKARPLHRIEASIVARAGHPLAKARSLQDLLQATWVFPWNAEEGPAYGHSGTMQTLFALNRLPMPRSLVRCNESAALLALLLQSDAIGILDRWQIDSALMAGRLQRLDIRARLPAFTVYGFYRSDKPLAPAPAAMLAAFRAEARQMLAG